MSSKKTALVTGSSNGIGESIAKALAKLDYALIITGRDQSDIKRVADECLKLSPSKLKPLEVNADLSLESGVEHLAQVSLSHFDGRLNLLVNNAGMSIIVSHEKALECFEAFKKVMQTNLFSTVHLTLLLAPALKKAAIESKTLSNVINISSVAASRTCQVLFSYSCSKAAMNMFTSSISSELAPLVRVNTISPGPIETKIIERTGVPLEIFRESASRTTLLGRIGRPEEVAECVTFLIDPSRASFITGANLVVDGGYLVAPLKWE